MADIKRLVNVIPLSRVSLKGSQIFTYLVPLQYHQQMRPGQLVKIPFGRQAIFGVTSSVELHRLAAEVKNLKSLESLVDPTPMVSEKNLALANWISQYYVSPLGLVLKAMLPKLVKKTSPPSLVGYEKYDPDFVLTEHQRVAVTRVSSALGKKEFFLLHGITGSGKTEVYMRIVSRVLELQKQVLILVPEISLTDSAFERFAKRFGVDNLAVLHSKMRDSERLQTWREIRDGKRKIVIGPRSAVFSPFQNLGLIVIDEEHDQSFKQFDQQPKYHAVTVAKKLAELWICPMILGDATPAVTTAYLAEQGEYVPLHLPHRIKADAGLPKVQLVDMRNEPPQEKKPIFSEYLKLAILDNLKKQRQIILFLNRRGTSSLVICRDCGLAVKCDKCSANLVWHEALKKLVCHHCGKRSDTPLLCTNCKGTRIGFFGAGTESVEAELIKFLKSSSLKEASPAIARLDADITEKIGAGSKIYLEWEAGRIQILIGTQIISKGWDISRVGLVGIISADEGLNFPDYRSNERTFQVLTQVAGRTGRGGLTGLVILQTYQPDNYAITAVKAQSYRDFYSKEIIEREKYHYPPFTRLVKLTVRDQKENTALEKALALSATLMKNRTSRMEILGPIPAFRFRLRGKYQFQIILKFPALDPVDLYQKLAELSNEVDIDVDPESLV